jgi:hypothetical protein
VFIIEFAKLFLSQKSFAIIDIVDLMFSIVILYQLALQKHENAAQSDFEGDAKILYSASKEIVMIKKIVLKNKKLRNLFEH